MLAADEDALLDESALLLALDARFCEVCGRSVVARFGGIPSELCASCAEDEQRLFAGADLP